MSMFTSRHYEKIAGTLYELYMDGLKDSEAAHNRQRGVVMRLADMFRQDNPRFDHARFVDACYKRRSVRGRSITSNASDT